MNQLLIMLAVSMFINIFMFAFAYKFKTDKLTDISYAVTFVVLALYGLANSNRSFGDYLLTAMVCVWAFRLGAYLLQRIRKIGKDKRFDDKRENFIAFLSFWLLQGFTVWVVLIPSILFLGSNIKSITVVSIIGIIIWAIGLLIETIADYQKYVFINNSANKGKWINTGLWNYSRHPNYFGEILLWFGIYIFTVSSLNLVQAVVGSIGPIYISSLLIFVSGIPLLEKSAEAKWGNNKEYVEYKKATSILAILPKLK